MLRFFMTMMCFLFIAKLSFGQWVKMSTSDGLPLVKTYLLDDSLRILGSTTGNLLTLKGKITPGKKAILVSQGYDSLYFTVPGDKDTISLQFQPKSALLQSVIITSSKGKKGFKDITTSITQVKPYLIKSRNNTELTEVINQIPSVNIVDNQASIRGGSGWSYGSGTRVLVTVDELPMISGDANQVQWQFLDMQNIESIEVLKGASSVLYGSSALNGVINISTKKYSDSFVGQVNSYFGQYSSPSQDSLRWSSNPLYKYGVNAFAAFKLNKTHLNISTVNVRDNGYRMGDEGNRSRLSFQAVHPLNDSIELSIKLTGMRNTGSTFLLWESDALGYTALDSSFNENVSTRWAIDPQLTFHGKKLKHQVMARIFGLNNDIFQADTLSNQSNSSNYTYLEYRATSSKMIPNYTLTGGLVGNWSSTQSPLFQGIQKANNYATYLQIERRIRNVFINTGFRLEQFSLNDRVETQPIFKAGMTYSPFKYTILRASYGQGYRFPSIAESFISTSVGPVTIYPNQEILAERSWNAEIGLKQGIRAKGINLFLDAAVFYTEINDMVEFMFNQWSSDNSPLNNFGFGFKSVNVGSATISGLDINLMGSTHFRKHQFKLMLGYVLADAQHNQFNQTLGRDSGGRPYSYRSTSSDTMNSWLKYRPRHLIKGDVQWDRGEWSAGISARYASFMQNIDAAFIQFPIGFIVPGIEETRVTGEAGNLIFDFRLSKNWKHGFKTSVIINNLLNNIVMDRPADLQAPRYFMFQLLKTL